jgi:DNA-binding FrmR family transcriptional regulator
MAITPANKEKLKSRLAKAIGHLNAVHRMVDEQKYCIDVLNQLKAVQAALDKTAEVILRQHLETCVVEAVKNQDSPRVIEELMQVFRQAPSLYAQDDDIQDVIPVSISTTPANGMKPGCCQ